MPSDLTTLEGSAEAARRGFRLAHELFPICRSITGEGVRRTLDLVEKQVPLMRTEVPSGTAVLDWEVPDEWFIRDAWIADASGRRLVDFRDHSLHVVSYSIPVREVMRREELEAHLHSLPQHPDWIPYRTSYYRRDWGFCLSHKTRESLGEGPFEVVIDTDIKPGFLSYGEAQVPGRTPGIGLLYTHVCHPSLANDNLTGIVAATELARWLSQQSSRLTWRVVFAPGTIGSLTWLARNEDLVQRIRGGLVVGLLGDSGPITFKRSRRRDSATDRIAELVLEEHGPEGRIMDFEPYGYDERQFCSPGFDLPVGRLTRSINSEYAEYHSSADDLGFVKEHALAQSIRTAARMVRLIDRNRVLLNTKPRGEPRLGKYGLYRATGGMSPREFENALLWVLNEADGTNDLVAIARRARLSFELLDEAARALEDVGLLRELNSEGGITR